jgi:hypothetical protein
VQFVGLEQQVLTMLFIPRATSVVDTSWPHKIYAPLPED